MIKINIDTRAIKVIIVSAMLLVLNPVFITSAFAATDTDGDGVIDDSDNCILKANPPQRDTDSDGYGNYCDPDFNNDLIVNAADLGYLKSNFFSNDQDADLNGDGMVNAGDLAILKLFFFQPPGPSYFWPNLMYFKYRTNFVVSEDSLVGTANVQLVVDTASLIAAGKMAPDCSDIRFIQLGKPEAWLPHYFETSCDSPATRIWVDMRFDAADATVQMYYGHFDLDGEEIPVTGANPELHFNGSFYAFSSSSCTTSPSWTTATEFQGRFLRVNGSTLSIHDGVFNAHSHFSTGQTTQPGGAPQRFRWSGGLPIPAINHVHSLAELSTTTEAALPMYYDVEYCKALHLELGLDLVFPLKGDFAGHDSFVRFSDLDGRLPRGSSSTGTTGGSATHNHFVVGSVGGTIDQAEMTTNQSADVTATLLSHTHEVNPTLTTAANNDPDHINVVYSRVASLPALPQPDMLFLVSNIPPLGYVYRMTEVGFFSKGAATRSAPNFASVHAHSVTISLNPAYDTVQISAGSDDFTSPGNHNHSATYDTTTGPSQNQLKRIEMPLVEQVALPQRNGITIEPEVMLR